jgi:hypothetical protein
MGHFVGDSQRLLLDLNLNSGGRHLESVNFLFSFETDYENNI